MGFRSNFEAEVGTQLVGWQYEPYQLAYKIAKNYTPDFVYGDVVVECKGYFRVGDVAKYLAINEECKTRGLKFVFVLQDPKKRVRKGAKLTMSEWCEKHDIPWFTLDNLEEIKLYVY